MTGPAVDTRADAQFKQIRRAYQGRQVPRTLTAAGNALITDYLLACDATSAGYTVTLPTVLDARGMSLLIVKTDSSANAVTIDGAGTEKINGALTQGLSAQWAQAELYCDGTQWIAFLIGTAGAQAYTAPASFTPGLTVNGSATGITYTTQTGLWTQIGKLTIATINVVLSSKGASSGNVAITGLPATPNGFCVGTVSIADQLNSLLVVGALANGTTTATLRKQTATGVGNLVDTDITNTSQFVITFTYIAA